MANQSPIRSGFTLSSAAELSDDCLIEATERTADQERRTTAEVLALLAELDTRRLYLGQGYSSLFVYCVQRLRLSESAAYSRITAARAARRYPVLLDRLGAGELNLTTISLLAAHLTDENHEQLLYAARYAGKRDVERLVASLHSEPDIPCTIRKVAGRSLVTGAGQVPVSVEAPAASTAPSLQPRPTLESPSFSVRTENNRSPTAPIGSDRYLLRVTISARTHAKLELARDLIRHSVPDADPAIVIDRALTLLVEHLERRKTGKVSRKTRTRSTAAKAHRRHVPAQVKRDVWARDHGCCAFVGADGRCRETGFLEYHHIVPYSAGGPTTAGNLELRCRAHNQFEATV